MGSALNRIVDVVAVACILGAFFGIILGGVYVLGKFDYRQQPEYVNFMVECIEAGKRSDDCHSLHFYRSKQ